jgi:hypothetical protein
LGNGYLSICDLIGPKELAAYYCKLFNLTTPGPDLENTLKNHSSTLGDFCNYIATYAGRQVIKPVIMMGKSCETAGIFKTLIKNLASRGVDTQHIQPSSAIVPLFNRKKSYIWLEEVNKLAPGSLTKFEYRESKTLQIGWMVIGLFLLYIIIIPFIWQFHWILFTPLLMGVIVLIIGYYGKPERISVGGYETVRDLVIGMKAHIHYDLIRYNYIGSVLYLILSSSIVIMNSLSRAPEKSLKTNSSLLRTLSGVKEVVRN